jgi:hypothetical protein
MSVSRLEDTVELALGLRQAFFNARAIGNQPGREPLTLFMVVGFDVGRDEIGRGKVHFQAVEYRALDRVQIIDATMFASAAFLHLRAPDALSALPGVLDGHADAAAAAL